MLVAPGDSRLTKYKFDYYFFKSTISDLLEFWKRLDWTVLKGPSRDLDGFPILLARKTQNHAPSSFPIPLAVVFRLLIDYLLYLYHPGILT